jgi:hypothetical protein
VPEHTPLDGHPPNHYPPQHIHTAPSMPPTLTPLQTHHTQQNQNMRRPVDITRDRAHQVRDKQEGIKPASVPEPQRPKAGKTTDSDLEPPSPSGSFVMMMWNKREQRRKDEEEEREKDGKESPTLKCVSSELIELGDQLDKVGAADQKNSAGPQLNIFRLEYEGR